MHAQLLEFKRNRKRMDPYDLKPMGNAKVPVNLEFFLSDCNNLKPKTTEIDVQTDRFRPVEIEEVYIPKKTGIDVETQILDWELFDFDREVKPIARVIAQKTLIQTALEIEMLPTAQPSLQRYLGRSSSSGRHEGLKLPEVCHPTPAKPAIQAPSELLSLLW